MDFKWFIILIYGVAKLSGFFFIAMDFQTFNFEQKLWNFTPIVLSIDFSIFAMMNFEKMSVTAFTSSINLEIIVNNVMILSIWMNCLAKFLHLIQNEFFLQNSSRLSMDWNEGMNRLILLICVYNMRNIFS